MFEKENEAIIWRSYLTIILTYILKPSETLESSVSQAETAINILWMNSGRLCQATCLQSQKGQK